MSSGTCCRRGGREASDGPAAVPAAARGYPGRRSGAVACRSAADRGGEMAAAGGAAVSEWATFCRLRLRLKCAGKGMSYVFGIYIFVSASANDSGKSFGCFIIFTPSSPCFTYSYVRPASEQCGRDELTL